MAVIMSVPILTIWFLQGGSKRTRPSIIRANLRIWSKIRAILGWSKFVSAYVEKDKKILKNFIFAFAPLRIWSIFSPTAENTEKN